MTTDQQYADGSTSAEDSTTSADEWAALPEDQAVLWRHLANWQANFGENAAQAVRRARAAIAAGTIETVSDPRELLRAAQGALEKIVHTGTADEAVVATLATLAAGYWETIARRRESASTGFSRLDDVLGGGLQPRRLVTLLGAPGLGKSALANQLSVHLADAGYPVLYLTTEDTPQDLLCKTIARAGAIHFSAVQRGDASVREKITKTLEELGRRKSAERLLYVDAFRGMGELRALAAEHFARFTDGGHGLVVVDYLQRIARRATGAQGQELRLAVSGFTDQLRDLARVLDCTVLALVSQTRAAYAGKGGASTVDPLASAKESGDLEYGADVLMVLGKDENRTAPIRCEPRLLHVVKNRQGEADKKVHLDWTGAHQRFTSVAE